MKMWAHLQREGIPVAKCTVERLMRRHGWQGVRRQKTVRTTIADPAAERAPDLVDRQFRVPAPNALLVADFTYVKLVTGVFVYVAFVIDAYAGAIMGWEARHREADPVRGVRDPPGRCTARPARPPDRRRHPPLGCRNSRRIQPVVATPCRELECSWSASTSAGVLHPSVFRGRLLSASATA